VDASLPVLVTRLPDRRALARLVRAALRHEVAQVRLAEAPQQAQPHTLDLRVSGSPPVSLLAEPAGAPQNGHFPLRLRPLHRAQAAELYALLESENVSSEPMPDMALEAAGPATPGPGSDTIAPTRTLTLEDSPSAATIAKAMSGSAPPPIEMRTIDVDAKRTVPSAEWAREAVALAAATRAAAPSVGPDPAPRGFDPRSPRIAIPDDPKRTQPSAGWAQAQQQAQRSAPQAVVLAEEPHEADIPDGTLSVSVVFEPDADEPLGRSAGALAGPGGAPDGRGPGELPDARSPADDEAPSLSVSVVFEPDELAAALASAGAPITPVSDSSNAPPTEAMPSVGDAFFDDALANLPLPSFDDLDAAAAQATALAVSGVPVTPQERAEVLSSRDVDLVEEAGAGAPPPPDDGDDGDDGDDDDDAETLIRLPGQSASALRSSGGRPRPPTMPPTSSSTARSAVAPAPPAKTPSRERMNVVSVDARAREELTPTQESGTPSKKTGTGGRKKKTTQHNRSEKKKTRHPAQDEAPSSRKSKPDSGDPLLGRKVADGKYIIESLIGAGAAGAVYKATHRELRRTVAIKVLHPHYQQDPHFMKSFRGEALAASQLDHPNVMRVLDFGQEPDALVYIVMEFLSGRTLQSLLDEERRLPPDRAVEIMIQVCAALSVAHDNGIIHRDIKPDNIMLVPSRNDEGGAFELVKVCDFGIAALQNPRAEDAELSWSDGIIAGTPEYMSPEQARGNDIDARSDVYACGMCLYELVTGRPPFLGDNAAEILVKQLEEAPRPPSALVKGLDPILEELILRAIQKDPHKRQQSARELRVELKELIDPGDGAASSDDDERSIVENVPGLDDPASGFPGFFLLLSSAVLRFGRFERGHPEAAQAMKDLVKSTRAALRGRRELTFARRDTQKAIGFCVMTGHGEVVDLKRLLGSQLFGSHGVPFIEAIVKKGIAALTIREGIPDSELQYLVEMLLGPHAHEDLRKELFSKPLRHVSVIFVADVIGRNRTLTWKVGLLASRLARDLRALSTIRGISLKKMREIREDLIGGAARLLTKGDEVRHFLFNADLVDETVANLRGFSGFQVAQPLVAALLHEPCAEAAMLFTSDFDEGKIDREILTAYLRLLASRLVDERSPKSDAAVTALYKRHILKDEDIPRDLRETIRASSLAEALVREPSQFLRMLDMIVDPDDYARELATLEAAMAVLARRAEAGALLAAISVLARHAKGAGKNEAKREHHALRTMKSMIDKQRLLPIATALMVGPPHQREAARQLLVLAGSAGAQALFIAREGLMDAAGRPLFVKVFRETGPAGWSLLSNVLPRMDVQTDADVAFIEDLLRAMPERPDHVLGDAVAKFLSHPKLRPTALAAIVPLWGERARKPLVDALEFAEEPARIVAVTELRRLRGIDEHVVGIIERFLTMRGSASEELRAAAAAALGDASAPARTRALALLVKGVEGKRGFVAMLRGDDGAGESVVVTEAMARALLTLDRAEGLRAVKSRLGKADGLLRARLTALLQG
jgi:serine/threonine-protein kinase